MVKTKSDGKRQRVRGLGDRWSSSSSHHHHPPSGDSQSAKPACCSMKSPAGPAANAASYVYIYIYPYCINTRTTCFICTHPYNHTSIYPHRLIHTSLITRAVITSSAIDSTLTYIVRGSQPKQVQSFHPDFSTVSNQLNPSKD